MKVRKTKVEFIIETDRPSNEIKKDIKYCFHKQFGIVSNVRILPYGIPSDLVLTFHDLLPHLLRTREMVSNLKSKVKHQERWDASMYALDEFEKNLDLSLRP